jgi:hypothetical protein
MSISAERRRQAFDQSISFAQFVERAQNFRAEFGDNYARTELDSLDHAVLARIEGTIDVLAIVEDWCPDVVANLPILARAADESDRLRLHVLIRDDVTRDVADAYPFEGRSHIPTYVFSDRDGAELGVIVERTAPIRERVNSFLETFFDAHPELNPDTFPAGLTENVRAELTAASLDLRRGLRDLERRSIFDAIEALASTRLSDPVILSTAL